MTIVKTFAPFKIEDFEWTMVIDKKNYYSKINVNQVVETEEQIDKILQAFTEQVKRTIIPTSVA